MKIGKFTWVVSIITVMIICVGILPVVYFSELNYNYDYGKCKNMKQSTYEFTHDVQINAEYSQDCYYIVNHPLAKIKYYATNAITLVLVVIFIGLSSILFYLLNMREEKEYDSYY